MSTNDITRIRVGHSDVSIIGMRSLLEEMVQTHAEQDDEAVASFMLERLKERNYIPNQVREEYGRAFVREFRKFLGKAVPEETAGGLDIKVLGMGCAQCDSLVQILMQLLTELEIPANLEHIRDIREIARYGVMGVPALIINGKVVAVGSVPPRDKIRKWLLDAR
ncbi:MAG: thioredoxin family protein [Syntrophobacteraceae bacterium]|nr:thioredoxin family protein [Syntrophobacteraceae bacterium]